MKYNFRVPRRSFYEFALGAAALSLVLGAPLTSAQSVDTTKPIAIKKTKQKEKLPEFEGTVMHANAAQITVRGKENELAIRTFALSPRLAAEMQQIIDGGGYQYGDKVKVKYDPVTSTALKLKGKPSKPR